MDPWTPPLDAETESPKTRDDRIALAKKDRRFFFKHYLSHQFSEPIGRNHDLLFDELDARPWLAVLAFRGWGKSTVVTFAETLWQLVTGRVRFAVLTGRTGDQTKPLVLHLRTELENNARLIADFGPFPRGDVWQHTRFQVAGRFEVIGRALGETARGLRSLTNVRPELWVLDDVQEIEDGRSQERIEHTLHFITSVVIPAMHDPVAHGTRAGDAVSDTVGQTAGRIRVVGTKMSEDCAMSQLEKHPAFDTFRLDAERGDPPESTEPARFPLATLQERRVALGEAAYLREYQNEAISNEGMVRRAWITTYAPAELAGLALECAVFWDPAIAPAGNPRGDCKAVVTLALHRDSGRYYVLDAFLERSASPAEQVRALYAQYERALAAGGGAAFAAYEGNGMQSLMDYPIEEHRAAYCVPPLPLQKVINTQQKWSRVATLVPLFEQKRICFDLRSPAQQALADQWVFYPRRGTDGPDAMHGAWRLLQGGADDGGTILTPSNQQPAWSDG